MDRALSAPGKLFVSGEYAVLWGGVARVLAVGPRVQALCRRRGDRRIELVLEAGRLGGEATPAGVHWEGPVGEPFHFVARAIDLALRAIGRETTGFTVAFGPSPTSGGLKLGLGSSARAAVLASEAARWATEATFDTLKLALTAHAEAQGGKGSGGDVAASYAGGFVRYRRFEVAPLIEASVKGALDTALRQAPPVDVLRLAKPQLPLVYAFSGTSASTVKLVGQVEARRTSHQRAAFVTTSDAVGDALEQGLVRGDFAAVHAATRELQRLLADFAPAPSDSLDRLLAIAEGLGCTGKQSGAGGGDGCLLIAPDQEAGERLLGAFQLRGVTAGMIEWAEGLRAEPRGEAPLVHWV